jgi:hypothetical protein
MDLQQIEEEKRAYQYVPIIYQFGSAEEREARLMANLQQIYAEVEGMVLSINQNS